MLVTGQDEVPVASFSGPVGTAYVILLQPASANAVYTKEQEVNSS